MRTEDGDDAATDTGPDIHCLVVSFESNSFSDVDPTVGVPPLGPNVSHATSELEKSNGAVPFRGLVIRDNCRPY